MTLPRTSVSILKVIESGHLPNVAVAAVLRWIASIRATISSNATECPIGSL